MVTCQKRIKSKFNLLKFKFKIRPSLSDKNGCGQYANEAVNHPNTGFLLVTPQFNPFSTTFAEFFDKKGPRRAAATDIENGVVIAGVVQTLYAD